LVFLVQRFTLAGMPSDVFVGIGTFLNALIARIAIGDCLLAVQQGVGLSNVTDMTGGTTHGMHQAELGINADMNTKGLPASR
jgi:hypothetical protein